MDTLDQTHPFYPRAFAHATNVLKLPVEEIKTKLREKSNWTEDRLPTEAELAILILNWCYQNNIDPFIKKP